MKKIFALFLAVVLGLILVVVTFSRKINSTSSVPVYTCEQEMQKKFMMFKVLSLVDSTQVIDAFGDKVKKGHWYIRCNSTRVIFPIHPQKTGDLTTLGEDQAELLSFPLSPFKHRKENKELLINNGSALGVLVKSQVLLLGSNELFISSVDQ